MGWVDGVQSAAGPVPPFTCVCGGGGGEGVCVPALIISPWRSLR